MEIVPQSPPVLYSPFSVQPPLLSEPRIAGLLPASISPRSDSSQPHTPMSTFTFADPRLADLVPAEREAMFEAAEMLLEISLEFVLGQMNDHALRAAQVLFHRQLAGHSPERPLTPVSFRAEMDADLLDILLNASHRRAGRRTNTCDVRANREVGYGA